MIGSGAIETVDVLGFRVSPGRIEHYLELAEDAIEKRNSVHVFYHNLHSLYLYLTDPSIHQLYKDSIVMIDGMPLIWMLRLAGVPVGRCHRITWVDFMWPLLERAETRGWRVYYLGSPPAVFASGLEKIKQRLPDLKIEGHHGYFDATPKSADNERLVDQINDFGTDLCLVGMGAPRQENWVVQHRDEINAPTIFSCGACMEYIAGAVRTPPRWMGRWGLEWSYRLLENPRRFAHRYLVEPWTLITLLVSHKLQARQRKAH